MYLSSRQKAIFNWWIPESPYSNMRGIIADGSIRAGKTFAYRQSFIIWAMLNFNNQKFGICGKTIGSVKRNILIDLRREIKELDLSFTEDYKDGIKCLEVSSPLRTNYFYLFAGNDERSQDLIQGITLAGIYLDEVALMPESFVNQATARCSVEGSKLWFNCNPDNPFHFFKTEWIDKHNEKSLLYLHFTMDDNPSLSEEMKAFYKSMYSGVFYQRYILGLWALAEGLIYSMFSEDNTYTEETKPKGLSYKAIRTISCDYGTHNPCVFLDCYDDGDTIWIDNCYYYDGRHMQKEKTDAEYCDDMQVFMGDNPCDIVVDPSATSWITALRQRGWIVKEADNDVLNGIRKCATLLSKKKIKINKDTCQPFIKELHTYSWDDKRLGEDKPIKENDHAVDSFRYYVNTKIPAWRVGI